MPNVHCKSAANRGLQSHDMHCVWTAFLLCVRARLVRSLSENTVDAFGECDMFL